MIATIAARELRTLFWTPLAWIMLIVVQGVLAWVFLLLIDELLELRAAAPIESATPFGVTDLVGAPLLRVSAWMLLLVTPLITMRLVAEERRARTMPLLSSSPISMTEIVLGKYAAVLCFLLLIIGFVALMPLSLAAGTTLDLGKLAAGLLGLALVSACFAAAGLYMSTLTEQPAVAGIGTFGLLLVFWLLDSSAQGGQDGALSAMSMLSHYEDMLRGLFDTADVAYYLILITAFLGLSVRRLDNERARG